MNEREELARRIQERSLDHALGMRAVAITRRLQRLDGCGHAQMLFARDTVPIGIRHRGREQALEGPGEIVEMRRSDPARDAGELHGRIGESLFLWAGEVIGVRRSRSPAARRREKPKSEVDATHSQAAISASPRGPSKPTLARRPCVR